MQKYLIRTGFSSKKESLIKSLYRLKKDQIIYEAGKGWYSTIKGEFKLNTKPVEKITHLIRKKFPLLEFSCWSTEQIKNYFHHLPSQFITFVYTDKDFLQSLKDFLTESGYIVYLNPRKREVEKYVELDKKAVILRPSISYRRRTNQYRAEMEKILVDLCMETQNINLIDMEEYKKIVSNVVLNSRINIAVMLDYAHNRKIKGRIQTIVMKII